MAVNRTYIYDTIVSAMLDNLGDSVVSDEQLDAIDRIASAITNPIADEIEAYSGGTGGGWNWRGTYNGATAYAVDDVVYYNGSSYVCTAASTGNLPTNTSFWDLLALKGADGNDGSDGADGADGADGSDGADGNTILYGSGVPSAGLGVDGNFYIDETSAERRFYGPKTAGAWGSGVALVADTEWKLIQTQSASGSSVITFTLSGYTDYKIRKRGVLSATNIVEFWLRIGTGGGGTIQTGASDYNHARHTQVLTSLAAAGSADSKVVLLGAVVGNASTNYYHGEVTLFNPADTVKYKGMEFNSVSFSSGGTYITKGTGKYNSATAITAVELKMSSGNITSGTFELYGRS